MKPETLLYTHLIGREGLTFLTSYTSILRGIDLMLYRVDSRQSKWSSSLARPKEGNGWERVRCWRSGESIQLTKGKTSIKLEFEPCAQFQRAFILKCTICHITLRIEPMESKKTCVESSKVVLLHRLHLLRNSPSVELRFAIPWSAALQIRRNAFLGLA